MKETVLDVLMYLFESFVDGDDDPEPNRNELKEELDALKGEHLTNKQRVEELTDEMSARERQLERAHEDVQRAKQSMEEMRGKMSEVSKTKDEGWKELNARIAELDQLREVISEQERILEERKVGLMSLETAVKDKMKKKEALVERARRDFEEFVDQLGVPA